VGADVFPHRRAAATVVPGRRRQYVPALALSQRPQLDVEPCRKCDDVIVAQFGRLK